MSVDIFTPVEHPCPCCLPYPAHTRLTDDIDYWADVFDRALTQARIATDKLFRKERA